MFLNIKPMKKILFLSIFCCLSVISFSQGTIQKQPLTIDLIWGTGTFYEKQPLTIVQLKDNLHYLTLESRGTEINKYQFKPYIKKVETLISTTDLRLDAIDDYILSPDEQNILLVTNSQSIFRHSYVSDIYLYNIATKKLVEVAPNHKGKRDYSFSSKGQFIVYSYQNNLYHYAIQSNKTLALTTTGKYNEVINGTADWVYEEEFSQTKFYDISHDGRYVAYVSFEQFDVPPVVLSHYSNATYPEYEVLKYPKVGEKNSVVKLHIIDIRKGKETTIDLGEYEYIPRLNFSIKSDYLIVQTMNRKQDHLKFQKVTCSDGKYNVNIINEERNDRYVEVEDKLIFTPNEDAFITLSDRDGYKRLYKITSDGKSTLLTKGSYDVQEIAGITNDNTVLFIATPIDAPYNTSINSVDLNGDNFKVLTEQNQKYGISSYRNGVDYFYAYSTKANEPKTIAFYNLDVQIQAIQEDNQPLKTELLAYDLSPKVFTKIKGAVDSLYASIIYPTHFDPNKKYPVYFNVYCGPGANTVQNRYGGPEFMYHELLAQKGYFVISVDTRGTLYRGAEFKKQTYGKLGELELEDLMAVTKEISKWNYIDRDRIGIQGWSYGGYMSSLAITKGADLFKMAIAVAPVTNWKFYDNVYTERYMNLMENNKDGYETTAPMNYADKLVGKFLLIHGDADDNVHVQNSMELADKLIRLNKEFDYFIYPNKAHGIQGVRKHLFNKMLNFTLLNL